MALFGFLKKSKPAPLTLTAESIKVLSAGDGCEPCKMQYEYALAAVKEAGLNLPVEYVTDLDAIMAYGVMTAPALVINDRVICVGKVLKTQDILAIIAPKPR